MTAFLQGLQELGWTDGRNVRIDCRLDGRRCRARAPICGGRGCARARTSSWPMAARRWGPCSQVTRTVPIVFVQITDPVGAGFVESLARPGGNVTGFSLFEYGISGKWLELLKEIAPRVTRAAVLRDARGLPGSRSWPRCRRWRRRSGD